MENFEQLRQTNSAFIGYEGWEGIITLIVTINSIKVKYYIGYILTVQSVHGLEIEQ